VKIANSFKDLEKKIGWDMWVIQNGYNNTLQEFLTPLFDKEYLQLHDHSIILTIDGFIMALGLDDRKKFPEVRKNED
jgi:hypothetical protein